MSVCQKCNKVIVQPDAPVHKAKCDKCGEYYVIPPQVRSPSGNKSRFNPFVKKPSGDNA